MQDLKGYKSQIMAFGVNLSSCKKDKTQQKIDLVTLPAALGPGLTADYQFVLPCFPMNCQAKEGGVRRFQEGRHKGKGETAQRKMTRPPNYNEADFKLLLQWGMMERYRSEPKNSVFLKISLSDRHSQSHRLLLSLPLHIRGREFFVSYYYATLEGLLGMVYRVGLFWNLVSRSRQPDDNTRPCRDRAADSTITCL